MKNRIIINKLTRVLVILALGLLIILSCTAKKRNRDLSQKEFFTAGFPRTLSFRNDSYHPRSAEYERGREKQILINTFQVLQAASVTGELKLWHTITVTVDGPNTSELADPNPFRDYRLDVTFTKGSKSYKVPGYYAADGNAAETGADSGNKWQAKFCPDETGTWSYSVEFKTGTDVAVNGGGTAVSPADGETGTFNIGPTDKTGKDFRAKGRLDYVGNHHLQFKGSGEYFFKTGVDSPENFLGFKDFDGNWKSDGYWNPAQTTPRWENEAASVKTYSAHVAHWKTGDPVWQGSKGKGIIGALNYLSGKGVNGVNPVTWAMWGDDPNVFMHLTHGEFYRFDCSKLDQWDIVFQHANNVGIMVHYKTQERENHLKFDNGTFVGPQRKLYLRELVARFGYHLGLEYNTGEEFDVNGGTVQDNKNIAAYIDSLDHFPRNILNHIYNWNEYYGENSFTGASVQNNWANGFNFTSNIIRGSEAKNKPWIVSFDEQGHHDWGVPPDSYQGSSDTQPNKHDISKKTLWGTIMAGGSGVMLYFGYNLPHGDKSCEDFTLRSDSYDYMRIAREFLHNNSIPFHNMRNRDDLLSSQPTGTHCLAGDGVFVVHFLNGGTCNLNLPSGSHTVQWLNPATGEVSPGKTVSGGSSTNIGSSPNNTQDWVAFIGGKPVSTNPGAGYGPVL